MVVNMASQDALSFFQPLSSWMSRMCEAVQHAGDSISGSFANLNKRDVEPSVDVNSNTNLDYKKDNFENYSDDSTEDGNSDFESSVGVPDWSHDDISLSHSTYGMDSQTPSRAENTPKHQLDRRQEDLCSTDSRPESPLSLQSHQACDDDEVMEMLPTIPEEVNSYGEDEDLTTSSDSDEDVIKQFEISVSRSQSFRSAVSEKATQAGSERKKQKFNRLLSNHEEYSTEASECEELDRLSQLSYQDISYHEDDRISFDSRSPSEGRSIGRLKAAEKDDCSVHSLSRQATEGSLEMETAFSNQGYEGNDATDSSSAWSPEEHIEANAIPAPQSTHEPISKCGDLDVIFSYKLSSQKLYVTVAQARGIPDKDRSGVNTWQVHAVLLPSKKQKVKTAIQRGPEPVFQEKFTFNKVEIEEFASYALRFRLYAVRKMNREKMMGEKLVYLSKINPESEVEMTLVLEPRINMSSGDSHMSLSPISHSDSASSSQSLSHGGVPELLVGLAYNATTGRLSVEIIKGSHFRNLAINRPPDTYGKLCLLNSVGQEMSRCKTSIRRGQPNPVYKETFIFQVALFQLSDVTLMISIYNRRSMKRKEMIGWLSLGQNSSGEEEQSHWLEMKDSRGPQICRWHTLLES